jgi:hypothetical protein
VDERRSLEIEILNGLEAFFQFEAGTKTYERVELLV